MFQIGMLVNFNLQAVFYAFELYSKNVGYKSVYQTFWSQSVKCQLVGIISFGLSFGGDEALSAPFEWWP